MGNTVDLHRGDQPCIVHLHTRNRMTEQELSPLVIRGRAIRQESKIPFDDACPPFGFRGCEAEAAACRRRARAHTPELRQDLRREAEHLSVPTKGSGCFDCKGMRRVRFVRQAQKDIRVEEGGRAAWRRRCLPPGRPPGSGSTASPGPANSSGDPSSKPSQPYVEDYCWDQRLPWGHFPAFRLVIYNIRAVRLQIAIPHRVPGMKREMQRPLWRTFVHAQR
jgi:hypothetical protein